jgi:hypothetical protein
MVLDQVVVDFYFEPAAPQNATDPGRCTARPLIALGLRRIACPLRARFDPPAR